MKSWKMEQPLRSRIPLPSTMLTGFFLYSIAAALSATVDSEIHMCFSFAILSRLGHCCLLHPKEIMKLVVGDLRLPRAAFEPDILVLRLRDPKNRSSLGRFQFAMCKDAAVIDWVRWYVAEMPLDMPLWPSSQARFGKMFRVVRDRLGWERIALTPGCLRPGGATEAFMRGLSVAQLKYMGRWRVESSLEVYIQEAMAHMTMCELSPEEFSALTDLVVSGSAQWLAPPTAPTRAFFDRRAQWRGLRIVRLQRVRQQASQIPLPGLWSTRL